MHVDADRESVLRERCRAASFQLRPLSSLYTTIRPDKLGSYAAQTPSAYVFHPRCTVHVLSLLGAAARQTQAVSALDSEVIAKRTKRHLDELERSNYAEPSSSYLGMEEEEETAGKSAKGRARQTISDRRSLSGAGAKRKKSTMNIRSAVLYKKNLATLIDESGIASLPSHLSTYLTAETGPPREPARMLCSVCGYWGSYRCKKCAMPYCDMNCQGVHDETRCERRIV
ncbi:hypothetical protein FA95DRAFT_1637696 [Auriscalpium vulgare]|uniref:Uncharacterized protein n=1 Tax=Auriscalpium vulgare TaxID=40419 RepID=A0ACB8S2U0_9AGAM|nr:hypothetical protein FA95DRAFT_1637696 [Auriscalpium vulgare]